MKQCTRCKKYKPATLEYFTPATKGSVRLNSWCKECRNEQRRTQYKENPEYRQRIVEKERSKYQDNPEYQEYVKERMRIKRIVDSEYRAILSGKAKHRHSIRQQDPEYRMKRSEYGREWRKTPHGHEITRLKYQRRQARKRDLPDTLTTEEWTNALEYFHGCCAVCGRQFNDLFNTHTLAADHWIPLSSPDCPGTVAWNIVPLCHGIGGCNNSKHNKDPLEWLIDKYGKQRGRKLFNKINQYLEYIKSLQGD